MPLTCYVIALAFNELAMLFAIIGGWWHNYRFMWWCIGKARRFMQCRDVWATRALRAQK